MKLPLARTEKLTVRELPEETLVYDLVRHKSHCLNRTAALVWKHCDGKTTVAEMAAILHHDLDLPADQHIVRLALDQLGRRNLLQEEMAPLSTKARMTRRDALKKIAVAAAALPIVMTLTARAGRVHASAACAGAANGTPCFTGTPGVSGRCQGGSCVPCLAAGASLPGCNNGQDSTCCSGKCNSTGFNDFCS